MFGGKREKRDLVLNLILLNQLRIAQFIVEAHGKRDPIVMAQELADMINRTHKTIEAELLT